MPSPSGPRWASAAFMSCTSAAALLDRKLPPVSRYATHVSCSSRWRSHGFSPWRLNLAEDDQAILSQVEGFGILGLHELVEAVHTV